MKRWLAVMCVVAACAPAFGEDNDLVLKPDRLGPVAIGASVSRIEMALRQKLAVDTALRCALVSAPQTDAVGVSYLVESNKVTRINVDYVGNGGSPVRTAAGIGLGSPEEDVLKAYPAARVLPNSEDPTWHYIFVDEPDHLSGLAFDTDGKKVKSMHAGVYPALAYKAGCDVES